MRVRLDQGKADPLFVYYWLSSERMTRYLEGMNNGGAVPLLNLGIIRKVPIPHPKIETQKRIASILSAFDNLIENNRRRIQLLELAARLLYKEWFVHLRFPGHEHI
jgi:type I restriction enzyme S subunit